jgi:hypothetical protein
MRWTRRGPKPMLQSAEIERLEGAVGELDRRAGDLGVGHFVQRCGEADLVEDFQGGGMNGVAAKFAVEVFVHFEKRHRHATPREEQCEHRPAWAAAHDAA